MSVGMIAQSCPTLAGSALLSTRARGDDVSIHRPVMLREVLSELDLKPGDVVAEGTLGLGGHSEMLAKSVSPGGTLVGVDWDRTMLETARARLQQMSGVRLILEHADFRNLPGLLARLGLIPNGILLDLGLNSAQIEDPERGISFLAEGPLDMRMDRTRGEPASALLNRLSPQEIERILWDLGDERWAKAIARKIVEIRKSKPLKTTTDLVEAVNAAVPVGARDKRIHPATRTFQAVRIAVNGELDSLSEALGGLAEALAPGGTMVVLSYHSGEDRIVKNEFRRLEQNGFAQLARKPRLPSAEEIAGNPRARSAKLRSLRRARI